VKSWCVGLAAALVLVLLAGEAGGAAFSRQDVSITMDDGVSIAATLYLPDGSPPAGGWPAIVFLHGLAQNREHMNTLATQYGFVGQQYAVLTFDARGHGQSGGLVGIDGPREVADIRTVVSWLGSRPDIDEGNLGGWGLSYGGGGVLNSLVAGVPWTAVVAVQTWTDLYSALMPQGLVKSGLVAGLAASIPETRRDPSLVAVQAAAFAGNAAAVRPWAAERSSLTKIGSVSTPVFFAQGRRDFLFGIGQATEAYRRLRGPRALYLGLHGHAPSTFPAADTGVLMSQVRTWLDCYLVQSRCSRARGAVATAPEGFSAGQVPWTSSLPRTSPTTVAFPGVTTFAKSGKLVRTSARLRKPLEVFGTPLLRVGIGASGGWSRLVAVLTAKTPQGKEIVVSAGGVPTRKGAQKLKIRLVGQATFIPRGSRLTLTIGSSSLAQSPSNLLYLDLPMPPTARVRVGNAVLILPGLRAPVTK